MSKIKLPKSTNKKQNTNITNSPNRPMVYSNTLHDTVSDHNNDDKLIISAKEYSVQITINNKSSVKTNILGRSHVIIDYKLEFNRKRNVHNKVKLNIFLTGDLKEDKIKKETVIFSESQKQVIEQKKIKLPLGSEYYGQSYYIYLETTNYTSLLKRKKHNSRQLLLYIIGH